MSINEVTNATMAVIEMPNVATVEDLNEPTSSPHPRTPSDSEDLCTVERSFRLVFKQGGDVSFYTDSDQDKEQWLTVLRASLNARPVAVWAALLVDIEAGRQRGPPRRPVPPLEPTAEDK